jgi:hypothetical protein
MIPYKWLETCEQYLAVVQPEELFIEGSIKEKGRRKFEIKWSGILKSTGEQDIYVFGFIKSECTRELAEKHVNWISDELTWHPEKGVSQKVA